MDINNPKGTNLSMSFLNYYIINLLIKIAQIPHKIKNLSLKVTRS
jgi:hypothetical protein